MDKTKVGSTLKDLYPGVKKQYNNFDTSNIRDVDMLRVERCANVITAMIISMDENKCNVADVMVVVSTMIEHLMDHCKAHDMPIDMARRLMKSIPKDLLHYVSLTSAMQICKAKIQDE